MEINIALVKQRIFERVKEIQCDYAIEEEPKTPDELAKGVVQSLAQQVHENPLKQRCSNDVVFKAAVRALASNSRKWSVFLRGRDQISRLLANFDIERAIQNPPSCFELAKFLPGLTSSRDACAMLEWLKLLSSIPNYYDQVILKISNEILMRAGDHYMDIQPYELFLCLAIYMANPPVDKRQIKWPGMGFVLGSEFLRNLHWNGFKPDRHIQRLLGLWTAALPDIESRARVRAQVLQQVIGSRDRSVIKSITYSLMGIELSPKCYDLSQVDNLVWLLGAYVEKKRSKAEPGISYLLGKPSIP